MAEKSRSFALVQELFADSELTVEQAKNELLSHAKKDRTIANELMELGASQLVRDYFSGMRKAASKSSGETKRVWREGQAKGAKKQIAVARVIKLHTPGWLQAQFPDMDPFKWSLPFIKNKGKKVFLPFATVEDFEASKEEINKRIETYENDNKIIDKAISLIKKHEVRCLVELTRSPTQSNRIQPEARL